tara:strand:- start:103 stop:1575 length:1473 start_codon:yes stop_codon:yes gene_type:complete
MTKSRWSLLLMLLLVTGVPAQDTQLRQVFSGQQINEDLDRMQHILDSMHPGLHLYITPEELKQEFAECRVDKNQSQSLRHTFLKFATIVDKIRCGHTYASIPNSAQEELQNDAVFFPLPLKFLQARAYVNHKRVDLPCGVEVLSINGIAISKLIPQLMPFVTGDGFVDEYRYELLGDLFAMSLATAFPQKGQFLVEFRKHNGDVSMKTVQGIDGFRLQARMRNVAFGRQPVLPFRFEQVLPNTAVIAIDTFDNDYGAPPFRVYRSFLTKTFKALERLPDIKNLILDLRLNEGGYTRNEMMLYSYLSDKPFREMQDGEATGKIIQYKDDLSRLYQTRGMIRGYERRLDRELEPATDEGFSLSEEWIPRLQPAERRFQGDIFVLTSGRTHSAGACICSRLRESDKAIFIGEETGGVHGAFTAGTTLVYALPNTGIELAVPILKYNTLKKMPAESGRGVKPDHLVRVRPEDLVSGEDRIMKFAIELVRRQKND